VPESPQISEGKLVSVDGGDFADRAAITALTQTFSTADGTLAAATATDLTDNSAGTANTTLQALSDGTTYANDVAAIRNNFADLAAAVDALIVDVADAKAFVNSVVDKFQAAGILN
jgi:hypothetical protein